MKMIPTNPIKSNNLFIGVLSGTSMDSIDAVLVDFTNTKELVLAKISLPFNKKLAKQLLNIIYSGQCSLSELGILDRKLGIEFAKAVNKLLLKAQYKSEQIIAIGSHGQNIWHSPNLNGSKISIQIADPSIISVQSKIVTIADFRRKDLALGGQGAPLAPGLHAAIFRSNLKNRAIINIGGISNITLLSKDFTQAIIGFDLGPGNCLMDEWVKKHFAKRKLNYDRNGRLASQGQVIPELLEICLKDRYFKKSYPKSTGREYFNQAWLLNKMLLAKTKIIKQKVKIPNSNNLQQISRFFNKNDVLTTLLYLTVNVIKNEILKLTKYLISSDIEEIYLCGGGAKNLQLLKLLKETMHCYVGITDELGVATDAVEGVLFAWLAKQTIEHKYGNVPSVTGAKEPAILGGIYWP